MSEQHDTRAHGEHSGQRLKDIFAAVVEVPTGERSAMLDRACAGDAALRARVEDLLRVHDAGAAFLANPTQHERAGKSTAVGPITEGPGSRVGRYKVLQLIGEGGFGSVFLAEQSEPVRRRVALKIIKLGMDTRSVIARFEAERQALALMDHPHIARVLDAGATDTGRPYFVMEYVTGDPITAFANAHSLSVKDRLALFAQVCSAVQHAHTKGVIHRDIKPGNVLVSMVDGKPFAKVIDFGIAKATGAAGGTLTDKTLFTEHRQLIGTPEYMSPEQAEGSPDIDTRTDVYALGVLLYELLTGDTPFDAHRLRSAAWGEMQRIIREEEPPMPSVRLMKPALARPNVLSAQAEVPSAPKPSASSHASLAHSPRSRVGLGGTIDPRTVKGELDWIVMKALDKDRARRYETPSALAADVERHMKGEAVVAAPQSMVYRIKKIARKHKTGVAVLAVLLLGLAGTTVGFAVAEYNAEAARKNAQIAIQRSGEIARQRDMAKAAFNRLLTGTLGFPGHGVDATFDSEGRDVTFEEAIRNLELYAADKFKAEREANEKLVERAEMVQKVLSMSIVEAGLAHPHVTSFSWGATVRLPNGRIGRIDYVVNEASDGVRSVSPKIVAEWAEGEGEPAIYDDIELAKMVMLAEIAVSSIRSAKVRAEELEVVNASLTRQVEAARKRGYEAGHVANCDVCDEIGSKSVFDACYQARLKDPKYEGLPENERALEAIFDCIIYGASGLREQVSAARLAEAKALVGWSGSDSMGLEDKGDDFEQRLRGAAVTLAEMLGRNDVWACRARLEVAKLYGSKYEQERARAEYVLRLDLPGMRT
ncbi:MAG TPA: serine/threonine-protein kinase [Phycisphaerales bacterium]|nr:serine/threonine-protein kinase [Phycisphaerales bacterium]